MWLHAAVVVALTLEVLVETAGDLLNVRAFRAPLPPPLTPWYPAPAVARARAYTLAYAWLRAAERAIGLGLLLAAWRWQWFGWLDRAVGALGLGAVFTGVVYLAVILLVLQMLAIPFAWYATFVVEQRYGFNRTSGATFAADLATQLGLAVVIGVPLLIALMAAFVHAGDGAWLWCLGVSWLVVLTLQVAAPAWLLPLFYTFRPVPDAGLAAEIRQWAERAGASLDDVHVVDGSRRSDKANAFLTGVGRHKRIALYDTLLERHPREEIVAVVLHEIGHHRLGHVWKGTVIALVQLAFLCWLLGYAVDSRVLFDLFGVPTPSPQVGLVLFLVVYGPIGLVAAAGTNVYARRCELEADAFVRRHMDTGVPLATALARLSAGALEQPAPHPLFVWLHREHPPTAQRMAALVDAR